MKLTIILIFSSLSFFKIATCNAQLLNSKQNFTVINNNPIKISYTNINEILETKIIPAAIEIQIPSSKEVAIIFASINFLSQNDHQNIGLKLNAKSNNGFSDGMADEIMLASFPTKILSLAGTSIQGYNSYYFDVIVHGTSKFVEPDNYKFTLNFTDKLQ